MKKGKDKVEAVKTNLKKEESKILDKSQQRTAKVNLPKNKVDHKMSGYELLKQEMATSSKI